MTAKKNDKTYACECGKAHDSFRAVSSHVRASNLPACETTDLESMRPVKVVKEPKPVKVEVPVAITEEIIEWEPQDRFYVPEEMKEGGFVYRWCSETYRDRRGMEHWEVVKPEEVPEDFHESFVQGGISIDGRLKRGDDMFLCRMPIARKRGRDIAMKKRADASLQAAQSSMKSKIGPHGFDSVEFQKFQEDRARPVQQEE